MTEILIALGSNLGDRRRHLEAALEGLRPAVAVTARSALYETAPMYVTDQPAFLNMAARGVTALGPLELLDRLKAIEADIGRGEGAPNGPRVIDLDILYYGDRVLETDRLTVPHPRIAERAFVLTPLMDIAAEFIDPRHGTSVAALHAAVGGRETVVPAPAP